MGDEVPPGLADGIDAGAISIPPVKVEALEEAAKAVKDDGQDVADSGNDITSSWAGLEGVYSAPEAETLFSAIAPVADKGDDFHSAATTVGDALLDFAEQVRPILARWRSLKDDAETMQGHIDAEGEDWNKDEAKVEEFNQLNNDLIKVRNDFMAAERECANKITAIFGGTTFVATAPGQEGSAGKGEQAYGYNEVPQDVATPWAVPQEHDAPWHEDVGAALWDISWGTVEDTTGMFGFHDGEGNWTLDISERQDNAKEYWNDSFQGMAMLAGYGEDGWSARTAGTAWTEVAHSMVPWTERHERPGYFVTTTVINLGSIVGGAALTATGAGAVVGVPLMAWRGTRVMRTLSSLGDVGPGSGSDSSLADTGSGSAGRSDPDLTPGNAGNGNGDGPATAQEIQKKLPDIERLTEDLNRATDLSKLQELVELRQPEPVGAQNGSPDIEADADGPDRPPSTGPSNEPSTDTPTPSPTPDPQPQRPPNQSPSPGPAGDGGFGSGTPTGAGGTGGGGGRPPTPAGQDGGGESGEPDPENPTSESAPRGEQSADKPTRPTETDTEAPQNRPEADGGGSRAGDAESRPSDRSDPQQSDRDTPEGASGDEHLPQAEGEPPTTPFDPVDIGEPADTGHGTPESVNRSIEQLQGPDALGSDFKRDVVESQESPFDPVDERPIADLRKSMGYHVTALDEDYTQRGVPQFDAWERFGPDDPGRPVEYKNPSSSGAMEKRLRGALDKLSPEKFPYDIRANIVIDTRDSVGTSETTSVLEKRLRQNLNPYSHRLDNLGRIDVYTSGSDRVTYTDQKIYVNGKLTKIWDGSWQTPSTSS